MAGKLERGNIGAQATAVICGSFLSGAMMGLSLMAVPAMLDANTGPSQFLRHWTRLYYYGSRTMPVMAIATCTLYASAMMRRSASRRAYYGLAAAVTIGMLPYTWIVMAPTNNTLFGLEAGVTAETAAASETVQNLAMRWSYLHAVRGLFPLGGAILGLGVMLRDLQV